MRYTPINITTVGSLRAILKKLDKYSDDQMILAQVVEEGSHKAFNVGASFLIPDGVSHAPFITMSHPDMAISSKAALANEEARSPTEIVDAISEQIKSLRAVVANM